MKKIFLLPLLFLGITLNLTAGNKIETAGPTANAGSDQTIYLTQTSSVTLSGSGTGNGISYLWSKVSTDQTDNATISSPTSAVTTVKGLAQGTWYYQLTVTDNSGSRANATVVIRVDYDAPPANSTLLRKLPIAEIAPWANIRDDTTKYWSGGADPSPYKRSMFTDASGNIFLQRDRENGMRVDNAKGKFYSTIEDGYGGEVGKYGNYARSELHFGSTYSIDSNKTYVFEWKGYFPQSIYDNLPNTVGVYPNDQFASILAIMQWHGRDDYSPPYQIKITRDAISFLEWSGRGNGSDASTIIMPTTDSYVRQTHTIRVTIKEGKGYPGQKAFIKVEVDGVQKYFRNTGQVGQTFQQDYAKFSGLYDWQRAIVSPDLLKRGKKFSLVTEEFRVYLLSGSVNNSPVANAGSDQTITIPTNSVTLSGSGSVAGGSIVTHLWTKKSGPSEGTITKTSSPSTTVTGLVQGTYQFELKVTDNKGATATSAMKVNVNPAVPNSDPKIAPVANAGDSRVVDVSKGSIVLSGSGTSANGTIVSYLWTKISGPSAGTIMNPSSAQTGFTGLVQGVYQLELKVTDNLGATGKSTMQVTVNADPNSNAVAPPNIPPTALAGDNRIIDLPKNSIVLSGRGTDVDGTIASYLWTKISGPSAGTIMTPSSAETGFTGLVKGVYQLELKVTDNKGATGKSTMLVTVNAQNIPPVAKAGDDRIVTLPKNSIVLSGRGTDADGTIASYLWTKISGPSAGYIMNPSSAETGFTGIVKGVYKLELKVTDNRGAVGNSIMQVTVNDASAKIASTVNSNIITDDNIAPVANSGSDIKTKVTNVPPIADAGNDTIVVIPSKYFTLTGKGSDANDKMINYSWNQVSGPSTSILSSKNTASPYVTNLVEGIYQYELIVTDNLGLTGKDTVKVEVVQGKKFLMGSNALKVYPNPVQDFATLEINAEKINTNISIIISDINGKSVYRKEFVLPQNHHTEKINMSNYTKGIYMITVYFDGMEHQTIKVVRL